MLLKRKKELLVLNIFIFKIFVVLWLFLNKKRIVEVSLKFNFFWTLIFLNLLQMRIHQIISKFLLYLRGIVQRDLHGFSIKPIQLSFEELDNIISQ